MDNNVKIIDTNTENISSYGFCGYNNLKNAGYRRKIEWLKERYSEGLRFKVLTDNENKSQGFIEYIPASKSWKPIVAENFMMINCIMIYKKAFKNKGYGKMLLDECLSDAKKNNFDGVAVITRKGSWLPTNELFLQNCFEIVDHTKPDFELLSYKFNDVNNPEFTTGWEDSITKYDKGLTIIRSDTCPYIDKAVNELSSAAEELSIDVNLVEISNYNDAKLLPFPIVAFILIYNGKILSYQPLSRRRFTTIMNNHLNK